MCQSPWKALSYLLLFILPTLYPFLLPINELSFASCNNEVLWPIVWNYRCSVGALCHLFAIFVEAVGWSGFIFLTLFDFCPFLDGSSTLLAGPMNLRLWLEKLSCTQPGWKTIKSVLTDAFKGSFQLMNRAGNRTSQSITKLPFLSRETLL